MLNTLLFIIFGFKRRDKDHGPTYPGYCDHCQNEIIYHAYGWRNWFHIFWIPLIPLTKTRTFICPICHIYGELSRSDYKAAKAFAGDTEAYLNDDLTREEYAGQLSDFKSTVSFILTDSDPNNLDADVAPRSLDTGEDLTRDGFDESEGSRVP